ncbi:MAG TPA: hypothetical protein VF511_11195, partial [Chthoniobacterales bacterium]
TSELAPPVEHLRKLLNVASGGVVLTPARPRLVGLRPALRPVYVGRRPPFSIHVNQSELPKIDEELSLEITPMIAAPAIDHAIQ